MKRSSASSILLTINGGSSSIKFSAFDITASLQLVFSGKIEGIGSAHGKFSVTVQDDHLAKSVKVTTHQAAMNMLKSWLDVRLAGIKLLAIGHRIVHGGPKYWKPQRLNAGIIRELKRLSPFDPEHLPSELLLVESFHKKFPKVPQIACFDTAFHHNLPTVARRLPIPRRYESQGIRRYGFHGLSCEYLMEELAKLSGAKSAKGKVVLAHLGNGASITAVRDGKSVDTSMSFTPAAGLVMSSRSGDLDPGLGWYLSRTEKMSAKEFNHMVNHQSGLLGISGISSDLHILLSRSAHNAHAAEAVAMFCYQARKFICGMAGALGGLDTLVFAGGIGEHLAEIRARICEGLEFVGIKLDRAKNGRHASVISANNSRVIVRIIQTNEEIIIAKAALKVLRQAQ